jgi:16S rRNA (guanine527-N7)-methyltransferase
VIEILERARDLGFLGPGPVAPHIEHAEGFALGVLSSPTRCLDLGSGGGLPGLVLAQRWLEAELVLLDATAKRCDFLRQAVADLGLEERVSVVEARAEDAGREPRLRASFDLVVARSFGPPAVTAECAAPFLAPGGRLIASEPPEPAPDRWPPEGLAQVGLVSVVAIVAPSHYRVLEQRDLCPERFPRRVGVPQKRPLF